MEIVKNGKALCGVVLPDNPTEREMFAAEELIRYIEKISGAKLEITDKFENKIRRDLLWLKELQRIQLF